MPPYRLPTWQSLSLRLIDRGKVFLRRAGTVILAVSIVLWILAQFTALARQDAGNREQHAGMVGQDDRAGYQAARVQLENRHRTDYLAGGPRGNCRDPRHYLRDRETTELGGLQKALQHDLTPGGAVALLVFFAFAMQCFSTIAVVSPGDRRVELADLSIQLYAGPGVRRFAGWPIALRIFSFTSSSNEPPL